MSDNTTLILGLATTFATALSALIAGVVAVLVARLNSKATAAAEADKIVAQRTAEVAAKAEQVRKSLEVNHVVTGSKLSHIETLVNGGVEKSLRLAAVALRRVATTTNNKGDIEAAKVAEAELAKHVAAQVRVDLAHKDAVDEVKSKDTSIGSAVGEIGSDVKEVKQDVKDLKEDK